MKHQFFFLIFLFASLSLSAAEPDVSIPFAKYGDHQLNLDIYMPDDTLQNHYCVLFAYGGGFMMNSQRDSSTINFCRRLASDGYVAIATDYRLGLEGYVMKGILDMIKPVEYSIQIAVADEFSAVAFILAHASQLRVRPDGIILCGSSAGAIISLQTDYELCNRTPLASILPEDFRFAGVASFSGGIYSSNGPCKYEHHSPAPTLMFHGTEDKVVFYNKIAFLNYYFGGSNDLVKNYKKNGWPYEIVRFPGIGHFISYGFVPYYDELMWFVENYVKQGRKLCIDKTYNDSDLEVPEWDKQLSGLNALYK